MSVEKYTTHILPYLDKIREMCLTMTEAQIAKTLGVSKQTFSEYKRDHSELAEALKKGRLELCLELKSVLIQKAKGMQFQERKQIIKEGKVVAEEVYTRSCPPDVAALSLLLKNYDPEWRNEDLATMKLKERQVEAMEKKAEEAQWR